MKCFYNANGLHAICVGVVVFLSMLTVDSWAVEDEEETFTVRMESRAQGTGFSARRQAILAAQDQIIQEVLKALAPSVDEKLFRPILQKADAYIKGYQVLRFDTLGSYVRVEIDAEVREEKLRKDLAAIMLPRLENLPTILLYMSDFLPETQEPVLGGATTSCQTLIQQLEKQRIEVDVAETLTLHYSKEELLKACEGEIDIAAQYARSSLKDVVIFGKADAMVQENTLDSNINRHHATVTLHVFRGLDGKKIDALQATAAVLSVNPQEGAEQAIRDACAKMVYDLTTAAVIAALGAQHSSYVQMTVEEPGSRERLDTLVNVLNIDPHVRNTEIIYFSEGLSRLKIEYSGPMSYLADYLNTYTYVGKILEIQRAIERDVTVRFVD
jgi:hypothetical protein